MPFLTYPLALLGLVAVPGLVAIYLLHRRFERREVSALFLWASLARAEQGGRRVERFRLPLLFLVELLTLLALTLAAIDLRYMATRAERSLVVVLDDSYSLRAVVGGTSARERGLAALREEMQQFRPTSVRVILAGSEPQVLGVAIPPAAALGLVDERWKCLAPTGDLAAALALAAEVGETDAQVLVVTDHLPELAVEAPRRRWLAVGQPGPNAAFLAARRNRAGGGLDRCFLHIANPGQGTVHSVLSVALDGQALMADRPLDLPPGGSEQVVFDVPATAENLLARLAEDALATDNEVALLPPRDHRVRVANRIEDETMREQVDQALAATGLCKSGVGFPGLVITDSAPGPARFQRWTLEIRVPEKPAPLAGPFVADWGHPLVQGLDFSGVVWAAQPGAEPEGQPLLMAGNTSLIETVEIGGGQALRMYLDASRSSVTRTPNWPALFWNLLNWRAEYHPGFVDNSVRLGQNARLLLPATDEGGDIRLVMPDGTTRSLPRAGSGELAVAATLPGIYSARVGDQTYRFACQALSSQEGNLSRCATGTLGAEQSSGILRREYASGAWLCGLLACALLALHAFLLRSAHPSQRRGDSRP
jgi:hypothetical protein